MGIICRNDEELQRYLEPLRNEGKTVVTTNGCFDIFSGVHTQMLREAAGQADILVVGVNSDNSVKRWKGDNRPIRNQEERALIVSCVEGVDFVVFFDERDCTDFVRRVRPNVHVNDASYGENCVEADAVRESGGRLHLVPKFQGESNSNLVSRIRSMEL
ncbi:MAG: adenylyltransferase/cytidyltransferase family protein [Candidatus Omnitrophica bacterium]|nr:adenylyltransferase/cytidyltransferase family protein [Candidatus Omnitrophota bacterium]